MSNATDDMDYANSGLQEKFRKADEELWEKQKKSLTSHKDGRRLQKDEVLEIGKGGFFEGTIDADDDAVLIMSKRTLLNRIAQAEREAHKNVDRFEVIDDTGRAYTKHNISVKLDYQDDGKTLKVFVEQLQKTSEDV